MIELDTQWREYIFRIDSLNKDKNCFQKEVTKAKKAGGEDPENAAKIKEVATEIKVVETKLGECWCCVPPLSCRGVAAAFIAARRWYEEIKLVETN